jgi:putative heme-binding domain-containing protein
MSSIGRACALTFVCLIALSAPLAAQTLEEDLQKTPARELATLAKADGDAARGAVVFFQQQMSCAKCHAFGKPNQNGLGPDLTALGKEVTDEALVEAVLLPSKTIRKGFESVTVVTSDGKTIAALLVERTKEKLVIRDVARGGEATTIDMADVEEIKENKLSLMPAGQVNQLNSRQQFFDLIRYLIEIRDGGPLRAMELQPPASLLTFQVPVYESHLDHAGLISDWNGAALARGEAIYQRVCANCHGTKDKPGSLPTSLRFAEGKFKNGSDPLSMYRTLTHGFGLMPPQTWMVPSQKYDVIHYVRETYLKPHNPLQYVAVDQALIARLPKGDTRGPAPSTIVAWSAMDYGPSLAHTYEIPGLAHNIAYKGVAVRLDPGAGGVSRGRHWMTFDTDTLRAAAAWNGSGNSEDNFIDWQGIQFNGAHGVHPRIVGQTAFANATGPGWANPADGDFSDKQRVLGRDGKRYGPLPREWARYRGLYHHGQQTVFSYAVGATDILEAPRLVTSDASPPLFLRTFNVGPRERDLVLQVAEHPGEDAQLQVVRSSDRSVVLLATAPAKTSDGEKERVAFDGNTYLEVPHDKAFDLTTKDFTVVARIKTKADGTILSLAQPGPKWTPDGQSFFVRDGRLAFDIGWVGAVTGKTKVADDQWHQVAVTWQQSDGRVRLYVDGKLDGEGPLAAKAKLPESVVRIGFTAPNFPSPATFFQGEITEVRFYQARLAEGLDKFAAIKPDDKAPIARWSFDEKSTPGVDTTGHKHDGEVRHGLAPVSSRAGPLVAGFAPRNTPAEWIADKGRLRLKIPAGKEPLRFSVWLPSNSATITSAEATTFAQQLKDVPITSADLDLRPLTKGGPPRWPQKLQTQAALGADNGPFATDLLTAPETNPWLAQTRFSGLDFFPDGRLAVCSWDGDVWLVTEARAADKTSATLTWQRIASGLFQPLGLKIVEGKIHVTCRDQLAVLQDLNGDGETDFYECLNNDHQVTEHFHEFAMGLQTDKEGNFYYAKSGCHGKAAVVPHHGTLLRVTPDGSRTDILATGFRAANGVCLNPDGSFCVTDQEGFWNPKNRINWVEPPTAGRPKFYGNMLGYHDVTDSSDAAMVPPLCWITNTFDRSPAELLWVESDRWGPLKGSLLNLSYGYGKVYLVPHEKVSGLMQGGMIELPIPSFPTGVMRGRFHPGDGQLYLCGMFAWGGNATTPGGLYRLRATGKPMHLPAELHATKAGLVLTFTEPLDAKSLDAQAIAVKTWSLKRTAGYGSKHFDEQALTIRGAKLAQDGKTLTLDVADLQPTWGMEIKYSLRGADGQAVQGVIHNTIHNLGE